jgi:hypothetical protein
MTISKAVQISKLYPSNVEDLTKTFRLVTSIHKPYGLSRENSVERQIQALVTEVETGLDIKDSKRRNGPYSSNLDERVDAVNSGTTVMTSDPSRQVPEEIRFIQLAHFHDPEINGQRYSYGLIQHFGNYAAPNGSEFAVLLPYERDANVPALMLSNNSKDNPAETLGLIVFLPFILLT